MNDLKGKEIFAVGKWNNIEFSAEDLDDIVANFDSLAEKHKVPLKFGHNNEQEITDGQPAIGWVEKIYRQGNKLLADFASVPNVVMEAIKKKLYRTVSVELLFNVDNKGSKYNHVLDAVAILGADQPAVHSLEDLDKLMATRTAFTGGHSICFSTVKGNKEDTSTPNEDEEHSMDKKEVEALIASALKPLEEANATLTTENKDLKEKLDASTAKEKKRADKEAEQKIAASRKAVTEILDQAVKDKKMTPALRTTYSEQIGVADDERVVEIDLEQVKIMCSATTGEDDTQQGKTGDDDEDHDDIEDVGARFVQMTHDYQAKHNVKEFSVAFNRVAAANPKLHREYLNSNGEKT